MLSEGDERKRRGSRWLTVQIVAAIVFSIGILVDDAIVVVENMARHYALPENRERPRMDVAIEAVAEVVQLVQQ